MELIIASLREGAELRTVVGRDCSTAIFEAADLADAVGFAANVGYLITESEMAKRFRLLARAQMHGEVREPGYVFTLEDGEIGPAKTTVASNFGAAEMLGPEDVSPQPRDVLLYEELSGD